MYQVAINDVIIIVVVMWIVVSVRLVSPGFTIKVFEEAKPWLDNFKQCLLLSDVDVAFIVVVLM